jgi:hypothetical protein
VVVTFTRPLSAGFKTATVSYNFPSAPGLTDVWTATGDSTTSAAFKDVLKLPINAGDTVFSFDTALASSGGGSYTFTVEVIGVDQF